MADGKVYTKAEKVALLHKFASRAGDIKKYPTLGRMVEGTEHNKDEVWYSTILDWIKVDEELNQIYCKGVADRAEAWMLKAQEELDKLEDSQFWTDNLGNKRERMTAVNKTKFMVENCRWWCSKLRPEFYGEYAHEIKQAQDAIKVINKRLDDMAIKA
jgi:hypothetical protein